MYDLLIYVYCIIYSTSCCVLHMKHKIHTVKNNTYSNIKYYTIYSNIKNKKHTVKFKGDLQHI